MSYIEMLWETRKVYVFHIVFVQWYLDDFVIGYMATEFDSEIFVPNERS